MRYLLSYHFKTINCSVCASVDHTLTTSKQTEPVYTFEWRLMYDRRSTLLIITLFLNEG